MVARGRADEGALDPITGQVPVALMSKDYHSLWLNSAALALADGEPASPRRRRARRAGRAHRRPPGGVRLALPGHLRPADGGRDGGRLPGGNPAGALPRGRLVHDKDGWLGALRVFPAPAREGALNLRVWQSLPWDQLENLSIGLASGLGDDLLRVGYIKAFLDGTLGSRTALMLDGSGVEIVGYEEFVEIVRRSARAGFPVAVHAIGDLANRRALDAYEETQEEWRPRGLRPRIEHAQLLAPEDVGRFAELGVAASVQFSHAPSDRDLADEFWAGKTDGAYAFRSLVDSGAVVANGSDAPVEEPRSAPRDQSRRPAVPRRPRGLAPGAGRDRRAGPARDLRGARLAHRGRAPPREASPGYLADLVVLDRDPLDCPVEELGEIEVVATMVGGRWVHNSPPWD